MPSRARALDETPWFWREALIVRRLEMVQQYASVGFGRAV